MEPRDELVVAELSANVALLDERRHIVNPVRATDEPTHDPETLAGAGRREAAENPERITSCHFDILARSASETGFVRTTRRLSATTATSPDTRWASAWPMAFERRLNANGRWSTARCSCRSPECGELRDRVSKQGCAFTSSIAQGKKYTEIFDAKDQRVLRPARVEPIGCGASALITSARRARRNRVLHVEKIGSLPHRLSVEEREIWNVGVSG